MSAPVTSPDMCLPGGALQEGSPKEFVIICIYTQIQICKRHAQTDSVSVDGTSCSTILEVVGLILAKGSHFVDNVMLKKMCHLLALGLTAAIKVPLMLIPSDTRRSQI